MAVAFTGRVVNPYRLNFLTPCINSRDVNLFYEICKDVLGEFRKSIEDEKELARYPLSLYSCESVDYSGNFYVPPNYVSKKGEKWPEGIYLDFKQAISESTALSSADLLLGSLGHELGHLYVRRLSIFYNKNIHVLWNELMSDFMGGFLFGLDQDINPQTRDMNLEGRRKYFPYLSIMAKEAVIPGSSNGFVERLDGKHPFCAARVAAIEMGFYKGCSLIGYKLPLGLTVNLARIFDEFMEMFCNLFNTNKNIQYIAENLIKYNPKSSVVPPAPTFFLK